MNRKLSINLRTHFFKSFKEITLIRTLVVFLFWFVLGVGSLNAQITTLNTTSGSGSITGTGSTNVTVAHSTPTGVYRYMLVSVAMSYNSAPTVSGVTYGGSPMTSLGTVQTTGGSDTRVELWGATVSGSSAVSGNVVVSVSGTNTDIFVGVSSFSGVSQITPTGTFLSANAKPNTTVSTNISSYTDEVVYSVGAFYSSSATVTVTGTSLWNSGTGNVNSSGATQSGASLVTATRTSSVSGAWSIAAVALKPASSSVVTRVAGSSDDAEQAGSDASGITPGTISLNSSDLELVRDVQSSNQYGTQTVGVRFNNLNIPKGATITRAFLTFRAISADSPMDNTSATSLTIKAEASDNAGTFTSTANNISSRSLTSASATWTPGSWMNNTNVNSPSIKTVVQEIVNRSGWSSGNSMAFVVTGTGSRSAASYNGDAVNAPKLTIEYSTSPPIVLSTSVTNVLCRDNSTGAINLTVSGGLSPYTYDWSNDGSETPDNDTEDLSNLVAGNYVVTVTDAAGSTAVATASITQPMTSLSTTTSVANVSSLGGSNGSVDLTVTGGTTGYTYLWSSGATTEDISGRSAGTYTVTVTDANGCKATTSATVGTNVNSSVVNKQLYFNDALGLDRVSPSNPIDNSTASTATITGNAAAVSLDNTTTGSTTSGSSLTVAHTTGSNANRLMLVGISSGDKSVSSVTYGGVLLTLVGTKSSGGKGAYNIYLYRLINPASGNANVVVNFSGSPSKGAVVGVTTYSGVNQTTPLGTFASATGTSTSPSVTVSSATGELIQDVVSLKDATLSSAGAGQTIRWNIATSSNLKGGAGSTKSGAASTSMSWTGSQSKSWIIGAVSIKPASNLNNLTFTQSPALCSSLTIKSGNTITVRAYVSIVSGTMPANPTITAALRKGGVVITTLSSPTYSNGVLTWTGTLGADNTLTAGQALELVITTTQTGVFFQIKYDSQTYPSQIILPVSTYINVSTVQAYNTVYPGGVQITNVPASGTSFIRATVTDPFGYSDINGVNLTLTKPNASITTVSLDESNAVSATGCTKVYQYQWANPTDVGSWSIQATAKEGTENTVTHSASTTVTVVSQTGPVTQNKQLYLSDPSQALDRTDPVASADATTAQTATMSYRDTKTYLDNFATNSIYTGSTGTETWSTNWVEEGETDGAGAGDIRVASNRLSITTTTVGEAIYRQANLTGALSATLSFTLVANGIGSGRTDAIVLEISSNGGTSYTTLDTYVNGTATGSKSYNILSYVGSNTRFRLRVSASDQKSAVTFDDVSISYEVVGVTPSVTFTESPALCSNLTIKAAQTLSVSTYLTVVSGSMPATPSITAELKYGSTTIATMTAPSYNSGTGIITWTATLASDVTIPAGQALELVITTAQSGVSFKIDYDSQTKPSKIDLPVSTYIDITSLKMYSAAYPSGSIIDRANNGSTVYLRAVVSDPFGFNDITALNLALMNPAGATTNLSGTSVATSGCTRTYEYTWASPSTAGDYLYTATAKEGLENTVTDIEYLNFSLCPISVTATTPSVPTCNVPTDGEILLSVTGGDGPYTYSWTRTSPSNNGSGNGLYLPGLSAGTYVITVTASGGCTAAVTVTLAAPAGPTLTSNITNSSCLQNDGLIDLVVSGGSGNFTYFWDDGTAIEDRGILEPGIYSVTVTDNDNGCTSTLTSDVGPGVEVSASGTITRPTCFGGSNGSIKLFPIGGSGIYTYLWSNGATTDNRTGLSAGTYTATVSDDSGCSGSLTLVVSEPDQLSVTTSVTAITCISDGLIGLTASGGTSPYTYDWADLNGTVNNKDRSGLVAGTYTVTVTDNNGCKVSKSETLSAPNCGGNSYTVCKSDAASVFSTTPDPVATSYTWTVPSGVTIVSGQGTASIVVNFTGATVTSGQICVKSVNICGESSELCYTVYIRSVSAGAATSAPVCVGGNIQLVGSGGSTYKWSGPSSFSSSSESALIYNAVAGNQGTYNLTVTDANGCLGTSSVSVVVNTPPSTTATVTSASCGNFNGSIDLSVSGGTSPYTYLWSNSENVQDISDLHSGAYSVTVTDANGCTSTRTTSVANTGAPTVTPSVTNVACAGGSTGAVTLSVSGSNGPPFSYYWSTGATTQNVSGLPAGTYNVVVTDTLGCEGIANMTITQPNALLINRTQTNILCNGATTGAITLAVTGGTGAYTYNWGSGVTTLNRSSLAAGTYTVTVTDANSCTASLSTTITQPTALSASLALTNLTCNGSANGVVNLTASGGTSPYTYLWSNGATTEDLSGRAAGSYSVTVTDANGCTKTASGTLTQPNVLTLSSSTVTPTCFGSLNGSINLTVSGGTTAYTYAWSNGATTEDLSSLAAGTYTVLVRDANSCSASSSITVTQPAALTASTSITNATCFGTSTGSINLTVSGGTTSYTYLWSNGGTTEDPTGLAAGNYRVTVSDSKSCTVVSTSSVTQPDALTLSASVSDVACNGTSTGAITLTTSGGSGTYTYNWGSGVTTQNRTGLAAGNYSVTVTDSNLCTGTATYTVSQSAQLSASTSVIAVTCNGQTNGAVNLSVSGGVSPYTFLWSGGETTKDISDKSAGIYTVTVTDAGACSTTVSSTVSQPQDISLSYSSTNISCFGAATGTIAISVSGGSSPYSYSWSNGATSASLSGLIAGTYNVTVSDANGCTKTSSRTLTQPAEAISVNSTITNVSCNAGADGAINITVNNGTSPYTYNWSLDSTTEDRTGLTAGTYALTVTDANACTYTASFAVSQPAAVLASTLAATAVSCNGKSDGSVSQNVTGGTLPYTYLWSNSATTRDISGLTAGTYSVTITDANNCTLVKSAVVSQPSAISITAIITAASCNGGADGAIDASVSGSSGGYSYFWSNNASTQDISDLSAGTYVLQVQDNSGCIASETFNVNEATAMALATSATNNLCVGGKQGAINLTVSLGVAPYNYTWSNGATTQNISGLGAGTYTVAVTDANNCFKIAKVTIMQPSGAAMLLSHSITKASCNGGTDGAVNLTVTGGSPAYTYNWSNGPATQDISGLALGTYIVTVTDSNGCVKKDTAIVDDNSSLALTMLATSASCNNGASGSINLTVSGGTPGYSYLWSDGSTDQDPSGLTAGTYTVTVSDANNCKSITYIQVDQPSSLQLSLTQTAVTCNSGGAIYANPAGGSGGFSYIWSNGSTTQNQSNLSAGTYTVTVTDANACSISSTTVLAAPVCLPPVAVNDAYHTVMNTPVSGTVKTNDSDQDNTLSELTFLPLTTIPSSQGTIVWDQSFNGSFIFTPANNFTGTIQVTYQVCDPLNLCDTAVLTITVNPPCSAPVCTPLLIEKM